MMLPSLISLQLRWVRMYVSSFRNLSNAENASLFSTATISFTDLSASFVDIYQHSGNVFMWRVLVSRLPLWLLSILYDYSSPKLDLLSRITSEAVISGFPSIHRKTWSRHLSPFETASSFALENFRLSTQLLPLFTYGWSQIIEC